MSGILADFYSGFDMLNAQGERLLVLNLEYWNCQCLVNYVQPIGIKRCVFCRCQRNDGVPSREQERINWRIIPFNGEPTPYQTDDNISLGELGL